MDVFDRKAYETSHSLKTMYMEQIQCQNKFQSPASNNMGTTLLNQVLKTGTLYQHIRKIMQVKLLTDQ